MPRLSTNAQGGDAELVERFSAEATEVRIFSPIQEHIPARQSVGIVWEQFLLTMHFAKYISTKQNFFFDRYHISSSDMVEHFAFGIVQR